MGRTMRELRSAQTMFGTYMQTLDQLTVDLDKKKATRGILAGMANNQKQLATVEHDLEQLETTVKEVSDKIAQATGLLSFDTAFERYTDFKLRLDQAAEAYEQWRKFKAVHDLNARLGTFATDPQQGPTLEKSEEHLQTLKATFEATLALAEELAPTFPQKIALALP